jgi:hypothetical protein
VAGSSCIHKQSSTAPTYIGSQSLVLRAIRKGAHVLALVRVADLNGELSPQTFGVLTRPRRSVMDRSWNGYMALAE